MSTYRSEAIKRFCLLYKQCEDQPSILVDDPITKQPYEMLKSELLGRVLERVSDLLLYVIYQQKKTGRRHLGRIKLEDLYHTAIVGLGKAAKSVKETEPADVVVTRIVSYVKWELDKTYPYSSTRRDFDFKQLDRVPLSRCKFKERDIHDTEEIEMATDLSIIRDEYVNLILGGVITEQDFTLFASHVGVGITYVELSKRFGIPIRTVRRKVTDTKNVVQERIRRLL